MKNKELIRTYTEIGKVSFKDAFGQNAETKLKQEIFFLMQHIERNRKIEKCDPNSVMAAVSQVALMGLSLNPSLKYAALVPFGNTCQLMIQYQGEIYYLAKNGIITRAVAGLVYENDDYSFEHTESGPVFTHRINHKADRGAIINGYAVYYLTNGQKHGQEIELSEIRKRAKLSKGNFWKSWMREMMLKTCLRMARVGIPYGEEIALLDSIDNNMYDLSGGSYEVDQNRLNDIEMILGSCESIPELTSQFNILPTYERETQEVINLFTEAKQRIKAA